MVVEELLKLLVDEVDGYLLEAVVLKDLEACDVQHSAEVRFLGKKITLSIHFAFCSHLEGGVNECVVALDDQPLEESVKDGPGDL